MTKTPAVIVLKRGDVVRVSIRGPTFNFKGPSCGATMGLGSAHRPAAPAPAPAPARARACARRHTRRHSRDTDTQRHRDTETQTYRHTDTQTHRHTDIDTQTHRHTDTQHANTRGVVLAVKKDPGKGGHH